MRRNSLTWLWLPVLVCAGCGILGIDDSRTRTLEVAPYKGGCVGLFETLCLQIREPGQDAFENTFTPIRGFTYQWGYRYLIRVEDTDIENPPADGSSIRRILLDVLSRTPAEEGLAFDITVAGGTTAEVSPDVYAIEDEARVRCPDTLACEDLRSLVVGGARIRFSLIVDGPPGEPFRITDWSPCAEFFGPCP